MKVVALGGAGRYCRPALEILAESGLVSEIVIAGRSLTGAEATVAALSASHPQTAWHAAQADVREPGSLRPLLEGAALLLNTTGPYFLTLLPALEAAIAAGAHYLDYSEDGRAAEAALRLSGRAETAEVTALIGMGEAPGLNNLLCRHAAERLDRCDRLETGWIEDVESLLGDARESLAEIEQSGRVNGAMQAVLQAFAENPRYYRDGALRETAPFAEKRVLPVPGDAEGGTEMEGVVVGFAEPVTLPRRLTSLREMVSVAALSPPPVNQLIRQVCTRMAAGEVVAADAAVEVFTALAEQPERWLAGERDPAYRPHSVVATGEKDGRPARIVATFRWDFATLETREGIGTAAGFGEAAKAILGGKIAARGVVTPEACFDPLPFLESLAEKHALFLNDGKGPVEARLDWLD
ncbi:MAG: saccharopine dehydrogenase NADP-binding domain-containing protein [Rhodovibrionaceae bacterium]